MRSMVNIRLWEPHFLRLVEGSKEVEERASTSQISPGQHLGVYHPFFEMAWLLVSMFACGSLLLLRGYMNLTQDMREPPVIPHALPYIGHLFGLLSHGSKYYSILRLVYPSIEKYH